MKKIFTLVALSLAATLSAHAQSDSQAFTVEKLNQLNQLHNISASPNGDSLIYGMKKGSSSTDNHLYLQDIKTGKVSQFTDNEKSESNVIWADDGQSVFFLSSRSGSSQIWQQALNEKAAKQISDFPMAVNGFTLAKNGQVFALSFTVKPGCETFACTLAAKKADEEKKYNIRAYDQLMVCVIGMHGLPNIKNIYLLPM